MTPYYQDDLVTIYHGDCREWMPGADALITDPPYGIGYHSERFGGVAGDRDFETTRYVLERWADHAQLEDTTAVVFAGHVSLRKTIAELEWYPHLRIGTWHKSNVNGSAHGGLWWSDVEYFVAGCFTMPRLAKSAVAVAPKNTGNPNWQKRNPETYLHPTQKPVSVMRHIIGSFPGIVSILDPFMGSGSTLVAAKEAGLPAIGIEIEERYCEIAAQRCSQEVLGLVS